MYPNEIVPSGQIDIGDELIIKAYPNEEDNEETYNIEATQCNMLVDYVSGVKEADIKKTMATIKADWFKTLKRYSEETTTQ